MPRKAKRDAQGRKTPWYSPKAEAAHEVAASYVRSLCTVDYEPCRYLVDCDALMGHYFQETGYSFRAIYEQDGSAWYKCGITAPDGRKYYLLVKKKREDLHSTALINLCEKIEEMHRGSLKPSPDVWKP